MGRWRSITAATVILVLGAGCSDGATHDSSRKLGSLTPREYGVALQVAKETQAKVHGTFVGATAVAHRDTFTSGDCPSGRTLHVRLVWNDDANFDHGGIAGGPPDGPRKALIVFADAVTGKVCRTGARYRDVGARPSETLLYGSWPDPKDS